MLLFNYRVMCMRYLQYYNTGVQINYLVLLMFIIYLLKLRTT